MGQSQTKTEQKEKLNVFIKFIDSRKKNFLIESNNTESPLNPMV